MIDRFLGEWNRSEERTSANLLVGIYWVCFLHLWRAEMAQTWIGLLMGATIPAVVIGAIFYGAVKAVDFGWKHALFVLGFFTILSSAYLDQRDLPAAPPSSPPAVASTANTVDAIEVANSQLTTQRILSILIFLAGAQMIFQAGHRAGVLSTTKSEEPKEATLVPCERSN